MTRFQYLAASLKHYRRSHAAVVLCIAAGTAVLGGALLVGDSMRGSLRELAIDRLGQVDAVLSSDRFVREALAAELRAALDSDSFETSGGGELSPLVLPLISLRGSISAVDGSGRESAHANRVQIWGVTPEFWTLAREPARQLVDSDPGRDGVVLGSSLAAELGTAAGDAVLLRFEVPSQIPREAVLGRKDDLVRSVRLRVVATAGDREMGRFSLETTQRTARNVFVPLDSLQAALRSDDRVNAIVVAMRRHANSPEWMDRLQSALADQIRLDDLGIRLRPDPEQGTLTVESERMVIEPVAARIAEQVARQQQLAMAPVLTYLANSIAAVSDTPSELPAEPAKPHSDSDDRSNAGKSIPYSVVAAVTLGSGAVFELPAFESGEKVRELGVDEIVLNAWAAADLGVRPGDQVELGFYAAEPTRPFETATARFRVRGIVPIEGAAADPKLVPEYPGVTDAKTYGDWDPPFPLDLKRVRPKDEEYWEKYRTTPKAFVSLAAGERIWGSRFGRWTSIRLGAPADAGASVQQWSDLYAGALRRTVRPREWGLEFRAIKVQALAAATGATDFSQLFLAFSFFLIASGAILVGLVFRLSVERRAREIGLLLAVGFDPRGVVRLILSEGVLLACLGGVIGAACGVGYAALVMAALRNWWLPAVGTTLLELHVTMSSLAIGAVSGLLLGVIILWISARGLMRLPARELLAGSVRASFGRSKRVSRWLRPSACGVLALSVAAAAGGVLIVMPPALFFAIGAAMLVGSLMLVAATVGGSERTIRGAGAAAIGRLGVRNAERNLGRSLLTTALIASATFVIVAVGANRQVESGAAGHGPGLSSSLVAESAVPILYDFSDAEGRQHLGFDRDDDWFDRFDLYRFRRLEGEDASCLNLYRPQRPRILGAAHDWIERDRFRMLSTLDDSSDALSRGWHVLDRAGPEDVVPAIGDANSVRWILHLGLGDTLAVDAEDGRTVQLQIVGLLERSVFQSELIISESNFRRLFPSQAGYSYFLIEPKPGSGGAAEASGAADIARFQQWLEQGLSEYGLDAETMAQRLAEYHSVENTYLSTFQTLGALGLMLGTLGLGVVLLRNVLERRRELALLLAVGYGRGSLVWMVLAETLLLLVVGALAGSVAALVAVAPHVVRHAADVPWGSLASTVATVVLVGAGSAVAAVLATLRSPLLPALRSE